MYRDNKQLLSDLRHNFVLNNAALGDMITSLPAIVYARQRNHPDLKLRVWAPAWQHELIAHLLKPYGEFEIKDYATFPFKNLERKASEDWGGGPVSINSFLYNNHTRNRINMVDFAFGCLIDSAPENNNERAYPVLAPLGPRTIEGGYVVFPTNATSENKMFRASVMRPVLEWCLAKGYTPVLVGTKTSHTHVQAEGKMKPVPVTSEAHLISAELLARCLDMREKTTLLELRDICGYAKAVVGVDGGTIHLAGTTMAPIVYALTTTHPKHRFIVRLGSPHFQIRYVMPRDLECAGCQSNWLLTHHDFRFCAYDDNKCTYQLHPDDFTTALKELGL